MGNDDDDLVLFSLRAYDSLFSEDREARRILLRGWLDIARRDGSVVSEALGLAERLIGQDPEDLPATPVLLQYADVLAASGSRGRALEILERARRASPWAEGADRQVLLQKLAELYEEKGETEEALSRLCEAEASSTDSEDALRIARMLEAQGRPEDAAAHLLERVLRSPSADPGVVQKMVTAYERAGLRPELEEATARLAERGRRAWPGYSEFHPWVKLDQMVREVKMP